MTTSVGERSPHTSPCMEVDQRQGKFVLKSNTQSKNNLEKTIKSCSKNDDEFDKTQINQFEKFEIIRTQKLFANNFSIIMSLMRKAHRNRLSPTFASP